MSWFYYVPSTFEELWKIGTSATDAGLSIAIDNSSNIFIVGYTEGELDGNFNSGGDDYFILKYDSNGNKQ